MRNVGGYTTRLPVTVGYKGIWAAGEDIAIKLLSDCVYVGISRVVEEY